MAGSAQANHLRKDKLGGRTMPDAPRSAAAVSAAFANLPASLASVLPGASALSIPYGLTVGDFLSAEECLALARSVARVRGPWATAEELENLLRWAAQARLSGQSTALVVLTMAVEGEVDARIEHGTAEFRLHGAVPRPH
jgi:hypothetical protein